LQKSTLYDTVVSDQNIGSLWAINQATDSFEYPVISSIFEVFGSRHSEFIAMIADYLSLRRNQGIM